MKKNDVIKRITGAGLALFLLIGLMFVDPPRAAAISSNGALTVIQPKNVYDIGEEINLQLVIHSDKSFDVEGQFFADGAQIVAGSIADFRAASGLFYGINASSGWNFVIRVKLTSAGPKTFRFNATCSSKDPNELTATSQASGAVSVRVRNEAERQQAIRQWQEEQRKAQEEAARQASIQASIAESRAVEIAIAASIDESIKESVYEEESIRASIEESIQESESEVERTRPSEIGEVTFARYLLSENAGEGPKYLYLMLREHPVKIPEGFERADYSVNENEVLALRTKGMAKGVYLVYGMPENAERPAFYYLNTETNELFPYEYLNSDWVDEGPDPSGGSESETETEPTDESDDTVSSGETETTETKRGSVSDSGHLKRLIQIALLSFLLGTAIATLVAVLVKGKKQNTKAETVKEKPRSGEETPAFAKDADAVTTATIEFEEIDDFGKPGSSAGKQEIDE